MTPWPASGTQNLPRKQGSQKGDHKADRRTFTIELLISASLILSAIVFWLWV
jgi:hypothetical protein